MKKKFILVSMLLLIVTLLTGFTELDMVDNKRTETDRELIIQDVMEDISGEDTMWVDQRVVDHIVVVLEDNTGNVVGSYVLSDPAVGDCLPTELWDKAKSIKDTCTKVTYNGSTYTNTTPFITQNMIDTPGRIRVRMLVRINIYEANTFVGSEYAEVYNNINDSYILWKNFNPTDYEYCYYKIKYTFSGTSYSVEPRLWIANTHGQGAWGIVCHQGQNTWFTNSIPANQLTSQFGTDGWPIHCASGCREAASACSINLYFEYLYFE